MVNSTPMEKLQQHYKIAVAFTNTHHKSDLQYIQSHQTITTSFLEFYEEYVYCVVASGFKGAIAGKLAAQLARCKGDEQQCLSIFKNKAKISSICKCWNMLHDKYNDVSKQWKTPQDLMKLPYIGPVTCFHLARNIGLQSCVKPDLHMRRLILNFFGRDEEIFVQQKIEELAILVSEVPGAVDFALWVYASHNGQKKDCCGVLRLR